MLNQWVKENIPYKVYSWNEPIIFSIYVFTQQTRDVILTLNRCWAIETMPFV